MHAGAVDTTLGRLHTKHRLQQILNKKNGSSTNKGVMSQSQKKRKIPNPLYSCCTLVFSA